MSASIKTLCAIPSVEEECFVLLDLGELVSQTLDLPRHFSLTSAIFEIANLPRMALPVVEELRSWTRP